MPKKRQTCTQCSMRRQRCDRNVPCGRCVARGIPDQCTTKWVGGYNADIHRSYPSSTRQSTPLESQQTDPGESRRQNAERSATRQVSQSASPSNMQEFVQQKSTPSTSYFESNYSEDAEPNIDLHSSGLPPVSGFGLTSFDNFFVDQSESEEIYDPEILDSVNEMRALKIKMLEKVLPNVHQMFQIVEYHIENMLWYHGCFHGTTFYQELKSLTLRSGSIGLDLEKLDLRWAALLFAILASAMGCVPESNAAAWGFSTHQLAHLNRKWHNASVLCLELGDWARRHHINSVSAVLILHISANSLGFEETQHAFMGVAVRIAQRLGLHRLPRTSDDDWDYTKISDARRKQIIHKEIGRRVWTQLAIQDWFSIPRYGTYTIQPHHCSTCLPLNLDERTLRILPPSMPTMTSVQNFLLLMARLLAEAHDHTTSALDPWIKHEVVLKYDAKLRATISQQLPVFLDVREADQPHWPSWVPWARRRVNLCYLHKLLMLHRPLLAENYNEPAFHFSRQVCFESARETLEAISDEVPENAPSFWIDEAFIVASGIALGLDTLHRKENDPESAVNRRLIQEAITELENNVRHSKVASHGVKALHALLKAPTSAQNMDSLQLSSSQYPPVSDTVGKMNTALALLNSDLAPMGAMYDNSSEALLASGDVSQQAPEDYDIYGSYPMEDFMDHGY